MSTLSENKRIHSIDILRGFVIVLMAIDHTRDLWSPTAFSVDTTSETTIGYFITRLITHFCAPVFVFLAGTSAFLYLQKIKDKKELSLFLFTRGLWLIFIEIFVINLGFSWTFWWNNWGFFLQVIWLIGICMICLAVLIHLSDRLIFIFSSAMIAGHNLLDSIKHSDFGSFYWLWKILHARGWIDLAGDNSFGFSIIYRDYSLDWRDWFGLFIWPCDDMVTGKTKSLFNETWPFLNRSFFPDSLDQCVWGS